MGGTEILAPLQKALHGMNGGALNCNKKIFLLTDGDVANADKVI